MGLKSGDRVTVQLPMDHHHGRSGAVEAVNEGTASVKFDDNARAFYKEAELNLDQPLEDPNVDKAYDYCEKACLIYQMAAMAQDTESKQDLLDWASDLEEKSMLAASSLDGSVMSECRQIIQSCKPGASVAKSQPSSSQVHVPATGEEDKVMKTKAHSTDNLEKLKSALKALQESLDSFLTEEEKEDVDKDANIDPQQGQEHDGEYKDPDSNPDMYPELDNLEVKVLKDAFNATANDDNDTNGLYDMQQIVEGMDWELEHTTTLPEEARATAMEQLEEDPNHYKLLRRQADSTDDTLEKMKKDTEQTEEDPFAGEGYNVDLGSGPAREAAHLGVDVYPYDHGTIVHDMNMGLPFPDSSVTNIKAINSLHEVEDPQALLAEIHRVMMPGGNFTYEGPQEIYDADQWADDYPGFVLTNHEDGFDMVNKGTGTAARPVRQEFTRIATPDPATANDAEPRIGASQYDQLPADALLAADAVGYAWSDATSSGRGNRLMGYPSQGALVDKDSKQLAFKMSDSSGSGDSNQEVKSLRFYKDENGAEDDGNRAEAEMTPAEQQVDHALNPGPVNPPPPKKPGRSGSKKSKRQKMKKGGPGSGPAPGSAAHEAQINHDRHENEKKQQRIQEQAHRNAEAYHRQASSDGQRMAVKSAIAKSLEVERIIPILKADMHKQIVYGVVLAPNEIDAQDDFMTDEDIESTAHNYLTHSRVVGSSHTRPINDAYPVESFIAPQDFDMNGQYGMQPVKKGSWILGVKIKDPAEWQKVVDGEYTGFSVGGVGERQQT